MKDFVYEMTRVPNGYFNDQNSNDYFMRLIVSVV